MYWISALPNHAALSCQNNPPQYTTCLTPLIRISNSPWSVVRILWFSSKSSSFGLKSSGSK
ncbi:hypothetical protein [Mesomycoplasma ovipneumoniae]|uniref:hypothetical protein n=1 Tax=Mesomycoplasma ovipneumoniae TaxID=29562 RepID=UPI0029656122|nr:hypothetical protein [Mesomycoplasma ovipneumoniae]MDW2910028.1 hypothetical protein [Mesomycoplasma ovipneumoniae]MDW2912408.1 hypothetical protein [Mesomycoplasma ovipneumoniae]